MKVRRMPRTDAKLWQSDYVRTIIVVDSDAGEHMSMEVGLDGELWHALWRSFAD